MRARPKATARAFRISGVCNDDFEVLARDHDRAVGRDLEIVDRLENIGLVSHTSYGGRAGGKTRMILAILHLISGALAPHKIVFWGCLHLISLSFLQVIEVPGDC
jgi:hypothetical protein